MEEAVTCTICSEGYKSGIRDPLILPCGHTFCRSCIGGIKKMKNHCCPTCREKIEELIFENLPLNFSIRSLSDNIIPFKPKVCPDHGNLLDLWCNECQVIVCGLCVVKSHRQESHVIMSAQDHFRSLKSSIALQSDVITKAIQKKQSEVLRIVKQDLISLLILFGDQGQLTGLGKEANNLSKEVDSMTNIEMAELCQGKLSSLQCAVASMQINDFWEKITANDDDDNAESTSPVTEKEVTHFQLPSMPSIPSMEAPWPLTISVRDINNRYAHLTWENNKFLLSAFQDQPISSNVTIQWNLFATLLPSRIPEAFMDLTFKDCYLGRVYIRLWGHLRRAHHFLALCLGSLGPSYKGGTFRSSHKDEAKERICGCAYKVTDGSTTTKGVMSNLEWDGAFAGKSAEGRIVGTSGGKIEMDALFSIYTRVENNASCYCPFGDVSSGLEVVRKAVDCNPTSAVTVSNCGAVISPSAWKQMQLESHCKM